MSMTMANQYLMSVNELQTNTWTQQTPDIFKAYASQRHYSGQAKALAVRLRALQPLPEGFQANKEVHHNAA